MYNRTSLAAAAGLSARPLVGQPGRLKVLAAAVRLGAAVLLVAAVAAVWFLEQLLGPDSGLVILAAAAAGLGGRLNLNSGHLREGGEEKGMDENV